MLIVVPALFGFSPGFPVLLLAHRATDDYLDYITIHIPTPPEFLCQILVLLFLCSCVPRHCDIYQRVPSRCPVQLQ